MKRPIATEQEARPPEKIEKFTHFIWAGGADLIPAYTCQNIIKWARQNSDFMIILWVDAWDADKNVLDHGKLQSLVTQYKDKYQELGGHPHPLVFADNLPVDYKPTGVAPIVIRDITQHGMVNDAIRFEIDRVEPNYGASSDQLRYRILFHYGGSYFDGDVGPGGDSLAHCPYFNQTPVEHVLYLDHMTQRVNPIPEAFEIFEMFEVIQGKSGHVQPIPGNDSFICTRFNPLMEKIITMTADNYRLRELDRLDDMIMTAYSSHYWKDLTLERTGTEVIRKSLESSQPQARNNYYQLVCNESPVQVFPLRHRGLMLTQPMKNTKEWLKGIKLDKIDVETSISKLIEQIKKEIQFFGVLRLDDHLYFLDKLALANGVNSVELQKQFCQKMSDSGIRFQDIKVAQWVSTNPLVKSFYERHHLLNCTQILNGSDRARFNALCELATSKSLLMRLKEFNPEIIVQLGYKPGELAMIHHALETAVSFIALLQSNPEQFERLASSECIDILNNVKVIANNFRGVLEEKNFIIDLKTTELLLENFQRNAQENDRKDADDFLAALFRAEPVEDQPQSPTSHGKVSQSWTKRQKDELDDSKPSDPKPGGLK